MDRIIYLDRDGTINEEVHYLHRPEDFKLLPGAAQGIRALKEAGFKIVVVTNQAGVARGYFTEEQVQALHRYINRELGRLGAGVDLFFYCPHHPEYGTGAYKKDCECRKPKPGLLRQAETVYQVDRSHSYMIGDKLLDVRAGRNYGVTSILVGTGYGSEARKEDLREEREPEYDYYAQTLVDAAGWILEREDKGRHE